jgi:hypothetical protein
MVKCIPHNKISLLVYFILMTSLNVIASQNDLEPYNREHWQFWTNNDHSCPSTRADVLMRDSLTKVKTENDKPCNVIWGTWIDPYTGKKLHRAAEIHIDHVVPLLWAHEHGGAEWPLEKKQAFAHDTKNMVATHRDNNKAKGSLAPNHWMPEKSSLQCNYLRKWQNIVIYYGLEWTQTERDFMNEALLLCP